MTNQETVLHLTTAELEAGLSDVLASPKDVGQLALIVRRPQVDEREELAVAQLSPSDGLEGDDWRLTGSTTKDGAVDPRMQLTMMNVRCVSLLARQDDRRSLAGDQLYVDLDLSTQNLPAGSRLAVGDAVIEVSEQPHRGCSKFAARFGLEALRFVNAPDRRGLRLRGLNARVITGGTIRLGDAVRKC